MWEPLSHNPRPRVSPRDPWYRGLSLVHPLPSGVSGLDAHPGPSGKHLAALPCLPAQSIGGTLYGCRLSSLPSFPLPFQLPYQFRSLFYIRRDGEESYNHFIFFPTGFNFKFIFQAYYTNYAYSCPILLYLINIFIQCIYFQFKFCPKIFGLSKCQ